MRILIADGDSSSRRLLHFYFKSFGETEVDMAKNGKEAIEFFTLALDKKSPYDLVCLDLVMPEIDGLSALNEIRKVECEKSLLSLRAKVIITSSITDFKKKSESYLIKPIFKHQLLAKLNQIGVICESPSQNWNKKKLIN
jgi:two-component system, chemotaxis family, chemotaxis protein CheY